MSSAYFLNGVRNFTNSGSVLGSSNRKVKKISLARLSSLIDCIKRCLACRFVSRGLDVLKTGYLLLSDVLVVNFEYFEVVLLLLEAVLVDAHLDFGARVKLRLPTGCALFNAHLGHA